MTNPSHPTGDGLEFAMRLLSSGPLFSFVMPLDPGLPRVAAGCYAIWDRGGRFVYAGMAGRTLTADRISGLRNDPKARVTGLRDRLNAHRNGRRSGDQFCVYVFDRFVLPTLSPDAVVAAGAGTRHLDEDTKEYVRAELSYRWVETRDGAEAYRLEAELVTRGLDGSLPYLNPRQIEQS
jgi:hypothetical protein